MNSKQVGRQLTSKLDSVKLTEIFERSYFDLQHSVKFREILDQYELDN